MFAPFANPQGYSSQCRVCLTARVHAGSAGRHSLAVHKSWSSSTRSYHALRHHTVSSWYKRRPRIRDSSTRECSHIHVLSARYSSVFTLLAERLLLCPSRHRVAHVCFVPRAPHNESWCFSVLSAIPSLVIAVHVALLNQFHTIPLLLPASFLPASPRSRLHPPLSELSVPLLCYFHASFLSAARLCGSVLLIDVVPLPCTPRCCSFVLHCWFLFFGAVSEKRPARADILRTTCGHLV